MATRNTELSVSAEQMARITKCVEEEARKARVAETFLPTVEVDSAAVAVPNYQLRVAPIVRPPGAGNLVNAGAPAPVNDPRIVIDHTPNVPITTFAVNVSLAAGELWEPGLGAALSKFRRAAAIVARAEDALLFNGQPAVGAPPSFGLVVPAGLLTVLQGGLTPGLLGLVPPAAPPVPGLPGAGTVGPGSFAAAASILPGVVAAIVALEGAFHGGPYACILSADTYQLACQLVGDDLPRDLIERVLEGGKLKWSSVLPPGTGLVVALGGEPIERVVARDITVEQLQISEEARVIFRVSERVALRPKDGSATVILS